jgi:hypothetical protein
MNETEKELSKIDGQIQKLTNEIKGLMGMSPLIQEKRRILREEILELAKQKEVVLMLM